MQITVEQVINSHYPQKPVQPSVARDLVDEQLANDEFQSNIKLRDQQRRAQQAMNKMKHVQIAAKDSGGALATSRVQNHTNVEGVVT